MKDCEYDPKKCNACKDAEKCDKVEVWNGYHGNLVVKAGTMKKIWFDTDEEDYDDI